MQDILLPLLVLNLLLTFWLLRQHILRQGRRHQQRNRIDNWLNSLQFEINDHDQALINHGEIFLEHRSAMAEINKDHYAINERLDGISVYDIKAILAGQERIQALESDTEAIKDFVNPYEARLSYLEAVTAQPPVQDYFSGRSIWDVASLTSAVGDFRNDFLRLERDLTVISQSNLSVNDRTCKLESELKRIEELVVRNAQVETFWMDQVNGEIAVLKNNLSDNESTLADQVKYHFDIALAEHLEKINGFSHNIALAQSNLRNAHETLSATVETLRIQHSGLAQDASQAFSEVDNRINSHSRQIDTVSYWLCENTKFPEKVGPFNPDTLIDSAKTTILLSDDDIIQDGDETTLSVGPVTYDWNLAGKDEIGMAVRGLRKDYGPGLHVRRTIAPTEEPTLESDRQEETADPVGYLERLKKKPNTDYTHDFMP